MKRLVILGEGHGELSALPSLAAKLLRDSERGHLLFVDDRVVRAGNALGLIRQDPRTEEVDCRRWLRHLQVAAARKNLGAVLAVFDGDANAFPAGSAQRFCSATAARVMAESAVSIGAGKTFSLAIVFACMEYETWIVASVESLAGKTFSDGRPVLPTDTKFPPGDPEAHGKRWLEKHMHGYRETRDQRSLTDLVDLKLIRDKRLRSFTRLDHAMEQILGAVESGTFIVSPE